jgi:hypothetical protein
LFKLSDILVNGTNVDLKTKYWNPVAGSTHPFCRCMWNKFDPDTMWSEEKRRFIEKPFERTIQRKSKIIIKIGDKEILV